MIDRSPNEVTKNELRAHASFHLRLHGGTEVRISDVRGDHEALDLTVEINQLSISGRAERLLEFARVLDAVVSQAVDNMDRIGPFTFNADRPFRHPRPGFAAALD